MAFNHLYCLITMEKSSSPSKNRKQHPLEFCAFLYVFLFLEFLTWVQEFNSFFSRFWSAFQSQVKPFKSWDWDEKRQDSELVGRQACLNINKDDDESLSREEVEMVMRELTLFCSPKSDQELPLQLGPRELSRLFEEKEPSLEEVKEAFDVFDQNKDGFIDATELQRVLSILGLKEGFELENCHKMIKSFDENGDGKIDFKEFVKFMENNFVE